MSLKNKLKNPELFQEQCYINGQWLNANSGEVIEVTNPANGETIGTVPKMGAAETRSAIEAAEPAFNEWKTKTAKKRSTILRKWYELIMENQEDLATIMTSEQGKPLAESRSEVAGAALFVEWFAEQCKRTYGDIIPEHIEGYKIFATKQPIGVTAAITPWNFPSAMITRKVASALAAGCTTVIKPASATPYSALALAKLAEQAGIPAGVINVVCGDSAQIGGELTTNPIVRKLSFTGSTAVGKMLMEKCSSTVKKVSLELGGNAPFIVFDDANIDDAVAGAATSKYRNSGQTCICANRIYVHQNVIDEFSEKLTEKVKTLKVGNGLEEGTDQGPLINEAAILKVEELIKDALDNGAKIVIGGKRHELGGSFFEPTIISGATQDMTFAKEEIFGPVAPIFSFKSEDEVITLANDTEYGLAAYFYATDAGRIWRVSEALEYGMIGINTGTISTEVAPFGGIKESGIGREGCYHGIEEYLETKYMCLNLPKG